MERKEEPDRCRLVLARKGRLGKVGTCRCPGDLIVSLRPRDQFPCAPAVWFGDAARVSGDTVHTHARAHVQAARCSPLSRQRFRQSGGGAASVAFLKHWGLLLKVPV